MAFPFILAGFFLSAQAAPTPSPIELAGRAVSSPQVASVQVIANVTDPAVTRDSCASVRVGDRALWTCRDTEVFVNGQVELPLTVNTASWTDFNSDGTPKIGTGPVGADSSGSNDVLLMYGGHPNSTPAFYPVQSDECPDDGICSDGTRWAIWPNSRPLVTQRKANGSFVGYTWIPQAHLQGLTLLNQNPARTLYKLTYTASSDENALPDVTVVDEEFWSDGEIGFGDYGGLIKDGYAYLYGQLSNSAGRAIAKVPVGSVEDKSQYQYYVNGAWTSTMPNIDDTSAAVANAGAGGQGTFYHSAYFDSYVWIGQSGLSVSADFFLTTAPSPEGPWIQPYQIYSGANGDADLGAYSLQAHPALLKNSKQNGIYLTWTQNFANNLPYVTPLVYVTWK